ncbi:MAG: DNA mismatch repair endonuclease MutL [Chloroflexota bacterium]
MIHLLPADLRAKIAAGEVIERPASVVKELVENSIDAGATRVTVEVMGGGVELIRVCDDGEGIAAAEVDLAFARHATSKLSAFDDLFRLRTLGFRGEALPSIAAVAEVELASQRAGAPHGTCIVLREGRVVRREGRGLPVGTAITVRDLFLGVPARRKFLKSKVGEAAAIGAVVTALALCYPQIAFVLTTEGRTAFRSPGTGTLTDVLAMLHGPEVASRLCAIDGAAHGIAVRGVTSHPGVTRPTRSYQTFFVNGRWVRNRMLGIALEEAYHTLLMSGRHPIAVLALDMPPDTLDVNVHPAKAEVKFLDERAVFSALRRAVGESLAALALLPATRSGPTSQSVPTGAHDSAPGIPDAAEQGGLFSAVEGTGGAAGPHPETEAAPALERVPLPALRVLGQANGLFIIAEGPEGVYMVDQHAAHERVLYDELAAQIAGQPAPAQHLLAPQTLPLSPAQCAALEAHGAELARLGFLMEPFGEDAILLRAVPAALGTAAPAEVLGTVLDELAETGEATGGAAGHGGTAAWQERALALVACHSAIRAGQTLTMDDMRVLVRRLETTSRPRTCPHGRPTMILLSQSQLEREFGRR